MGIGDAEGNLHLTLSTWGDGVHTLLPRTQAVGMALAGTIEMVPWEDVMALAGDCLVQVPDLYPPRWETKRFPDEATLAKLATHALTKGAKAGTPGKPRSEAGLEAAPPAGSSLLFRLAIIAAVVGLIVYLIAR
jgi:hypothetical protein